VLGREPVEGQQLGLGVLQQAGDLGRVRLELLDDLPEPRSGLGGRGGGEDPADGARHQRLLRASEVAEHVAQEVDGAALPATAQHLRDRGLEAGMGVGDAQLDAVQPTGPQASQERPPEGLGLGLAHVQADHLAAAAVVDAVGDRKRLVPDPTRLPDPLHLGVQPQVRVGALQRPLAKDTDLLVQAAAQPRHPVLAQVVQAHLLDQPVDLAGGHAVDVGLLHHRDQGLLARRRGSKKLGK
jgi:hypothetical protein